MHFTAYQSGALKNWSAHIVDLPGAGEIRGKQFLKELLGLTLAAKENEVKAG